LQLATISQVMQLVAIIGEGLAQVIVGPINIDHYSHVLHYSKLLVAGFTVTFIDPIDGPLKGFSNFGRDVLKGDCTIVINGHYNLSLEHHKLALSNADNALKGQVEDCWLIRFDNLGLIQGPLGYGLSIPVTRVKISLQVVISCIILQSFVVPQESVW
jgi:hypothetical protein